MDQTRAPAPGALPLLAYVYNPRSFPTLSLVEAADGLCELCWVVDTASDEVAQMSRLLRRLGRVVDVAAMEPDEAAAAVAGHAPAGILALADDELCRTAQLAARLALPFHSPETTARLTDKFAQRAALRDAGLAAPGSWVIPVDATDAVWARIRDEARFPAVLKPRRGEGSRDTVPVSSYDELRTLVEEVTASHHVPRELVVEEYIADAPGPIAGEGFAGYVSVESFVCDGRVTHLAVNGRMPPAVPFRETGFFIPSALDAAQVRAVLATAGAASTALGVTTGCLHTEVKLTPAGPVVIEVNGRIGGGVPELLGAVTDVRLLSLAMRLALGETVTCDEMPRCDGLSYLFYVQAPASMHTITSIEGLDALRAVDGVHDVVLNRVVGEHVDWREGNHGHVLSVFGTTADHDGLRRVDQLVSSLVRIEGT